MPARNQKPVIFLAFANARDERVPYLRNLPEEQRQIRHALEPARAAGLCEIIERSNVMAQDIWDVFQHPEYRDRIAIFHYGGHANGYQLLLETALGESTPAYSQGLAEFLGGQRALQLIFLNGCSTQPQVMGLLRTNVSVVIATSQAIIDQIACQFAVRFYAGLAGGATIRTAFNEAAASIKAELGEDLTQYYRECGLEVDHWPWDIFIKKDAEIADDWNLPDAANDPLFGLPEIPPGNLPKTPFRFLQWFDRDHAEVFFGREYQIRSLFDKITSIHTAPIQLVYGQCGVGKSSVLAGGLIGRLSAIGEVRFYRARRDLTLLENLNNAFHPYAPTNWQKLEKELNKPLIVVLDQFESPFCHAKPKQLRQFFEQLEAIFFSREGIPRGKLVLVFRKDWLAEIEMRCREHKLPIELTFIERLDRRGIIEAITGLTKRQRLKEFYGLSIEPGLEEIITDDLLEDPESPLAPTLQLLLSNMWVHAHRINRERPFFSIAIYQKLKKQGILLNDFFHQQMEKLRRWRKEVVDSGLALDVLAYHTTPMGTAEQRTRRQLRERYAHRMDILGALIQKLKNLYLLTDPSRSLSGRASGRITRLAHDTLAPIIRDRYEKSNCPGQRASRILAAKRIDSSAPQQIWLDEPDLQIVELGLSGMRSLTAEEQRLIQISQERRARNRRKRRMVWATGLFMVLLIALFAVGAIRNMHKAQRQERAAKVNYLTILANNMANTDRQKALRFAQAAYELSQPNPPVHLRQLLYRIFWQPPDQALFDKRFPHELLVSSVSFSPDGSKILTASWDCTAKIWTPEGKLLHVLKRPAPITSARFSPNSEKIALGLANARAEVWSETGDSLMAFHHRSQVNCVAFSPDGNKVVTASSDSTAKLWSIDGRLLASFPHDDQVISAVFSNHGKRVLTAAFDNMARL